MAKKLTKSKAREILHDKEVHGHPLTDRQRRFFGAIASAQNGIEGTMGGLTDKGFNFNPAWGGAWENGGWMDKYEDGGSILQPPMAGANQTVPMAQFGFNTPLKFLQPDSKQLPLVGNHSELAMSIGGENGEPAYLIPSFKYGKPLKDPYAEFKKTGEYLGGPFKTWQEADEWEKNTRHPFVEKGQPIPAPYRTKGKEFAMGGNIPGSVGFTYARTGAPSNGPHAKKTLASAQNGQEMSFYQAGLDFQPKTISKNGGWLDKYNEDVPQAQGGIDLLPGYAKQYLAGNQGDMSSTYPKPKPVNVEPSVQQKQKTYTTLRSNPHLSRYSDAEVKRIAGTPRSNWPSFVKGAINEQDNTTYNVINHPDYDPNKPVEQQTDLAYDNSLRTMVLRGRNKFVNSGNPALDFANQLWTAPGSAFANMSMDAEKRYLNNGFLGGLGNLTEDVLMVAPEIPIRGLQAGIKAAPKVGEYLTTQTPLRNAYKINPWAGTFAGESKLPNFLQLNKLDDPNAFYRLTKDPKNYGLQEGAYFNKGVPLTQELAETFPKGSRAWKHRYSGLNYNPATGKIDMYSGPDYLFKVKDESFMSPYLDFPEPHLKFYTQSGEIPTESSQLFKKDWLRGYQEVPKPTSVSSNISDKDKLLSIIKEKYPSWFIKEPSKTKLTDIAAQKESVEFLKNFLKDPNKQSLYTPVDLKIPRYGTNDLGLNPHLEGGRSMRNIDRGSGLFKNSADKFGEGYNLYDLLDATQYHIRKNKQGGVVKNGQIPQAQYGDLIPAAGRAYLSGTQGDIPRPSAQKFAEQQKIDEYNKKMTVYNAANQGRTYVAPTKQLTPYEEQKHQEFRRNQLEQYAATHPEQKVNEFGDLTMSPYGEFIQKYGNNLDKFAESWETPLAIEGALSAAPLLGKGLLNVGKATTKYLNSLNIYKNLPEDAIISLSGLGKKNPYLHNKKQILLSDFENDINQELLKGLNIKKVPGELKVKVQSGNTNYAEYDPKFTVDLYHDNKNIGYVGLDKLNTSDYNIPGVSGTIYNKVADQPYAWAEHLKGKGISGEVNKAITNALQSNNLPHLYSSLVHTPEGISRWKNLVDKGKAVEVAPNRFKLLEKGGVVKDDMGYWNPQNWGKVVEIDSNDITMQGVNQPLLGISDAGDVQYMEPGKDYKFRGKKVKEYPVGAKGVSVNKADEYPLEKLDNLLNFTNYNKKAKSGGWLDKYQ